MPCMQYTGRFCAYVYFEGLRINLGTFDTKERAVIAEKIAKYWKIIGMIPPSKNRTIDAV